MPSDAMDAPPDEPFDRPIRLAEIVRPGLRAIRTVWRPFTLVLACAAGVVVAYYNVPAFARACEGIAQVRARWGYAFSAVGGVVAGSFVPELFKRLTLPGHRLGGRAGEIALDCLYFAFMGMLVDTLYRVLNVVVGVDSTWRNATIKMLCDQVIFTPTLGLGIAAVYFPLRQSGWDFARIFRGFGTPRWYARRVLPLVAPGWCFWIPMTFLVYSMPALLQMPLTLCGSAAWSVLMIAITRARPPVDPVRAVAEAEQFNR